MWISLSLFSRSVVWAGRIAPDVAEHIVGDVERQPRARQRMLDLRHGGEVVAIKYATETTFDQARDTRLVYICIKNAVTHKPVSKPSALADDDDGDESLVVAVLRLRACNVAACAI